jgi:hypothetical protein
VVQFHPLQAVVPEHSASQGLLVRYPQRQGAAHGFTGLLARGVLFHRPRAGAHAPIPLHVLVGQLAQLQGALLGPSQSLGAAGVSL